MPTERRGIPWLLLFGWLLLAGWLAVVSRSGLVSETVAPWPGVGAAMLLASAALFVGYWLNHLGWGLATALLLSLHPHFWRAARSGATHLLAEGLGLVTFASTLAAWRLIFSRRLSWPGWGLVGLGWILSLALLWTIEPHTALIGSTMVLLGTLLAVIVARRSWRRLVLMGLLCLAALASGFLTDRDFPERLGSAWQPDPFSIEQLGFAAPDLDGWCWPAVWVILPLMVLGLWRSLRRGWKLSAQGKPPFGWLLTLYAGVTMAGVALYPSSARHAEFLSLAILSVILAVFCVADWIRGLGERLVLAPPDEGDKVTG